MKQLFSLIFEIYFTLIECMYLLNNSNTINFVKQFFNGFYSWLSNFILINI